MRFDRSTFSQSAMTSDLNARTLRVSSLATLSLLAVAIAAVASPALAEESIGGARTVVNLVTGDLSTGDKVNVVQGDDVFRDEGVKTDADSSARLVLRDNTNMLLGPSSSLKLDRFVYAGPSQPGAIAINLVKGALRFATGDADKKAYVIATPTAALGVRGTVLKIVSESSTATSPAKTFVLLDEGASLVCTRGAAKKHCLNLTEPGQTVEVTATEIKWNAGAAAKVSAIIDAIPDAPSGPSGPPSQHAGVTPTIVTTIVAKPPPHGGGGCGGGEGEGAHGFGGFGGPGAPGHGPGHNGPGH